LQRVEPRLPRTFEEKQSMPRVIVILEHANLETANTKKGIELLNCDDHQRLITKMKRTLEEFRPDVLHQCLLSLLDSPLNKAGLLQVYVRTAKNVLFEINPQTRIPRTFKRFSGLMAQLITNMKIRAAGSSVTLMKVIKNPVTAHLPIGVKKIGTSTKGKLVHLPTYVKELMGD
jgi:rRNA small subunit pseudouridine methyltransferase Nep1